MTPEEFLDSRRGSFYPTWARANCLVTQAIKLGVLVREPCKHCGSGKKAEAHHHNYHKPLDVIWLCRPCHRAEHARLRREGVVIPGSYAEEFPRKKRKRVTQ